MSEVIEQENLSRSRQLKEATHTTHDGLDKTIMAADPFASQARYARFVQVQQAFHRHIDALYDNETLAGLLPDMAGRRRLDKILQDLADLNATPEPEDAAPVFAAGAAVDVPTALGWLYVAEGSNLGAAFLLKAAEKIDLSAEFGARHLAAAPEGRGLHWRTFTAALDNLPLSDEEELRVIEGARAAFACVRGKVDQYMV